MNGVIILDDTLIIFIIYAQKLEVPLIVEIRIQKAKIRSVYNSPMEPPIKPDESDCCNSGCNPCILDVYEDQLKKYNKLKDSTDEGRREVTNCLSSTTYTIFKLIDIEKHCEDAFLFSFEYNRPLKRQLADDDLSIIYKPGQYFLLKAGSENDEFTRAYTPIPIEKTQKQQFTTLIKVYKIGRMSNFINRRFSVGLETSWRGPYGEFEISYDHKYIIFIAQGTGIAPIYSIICNILKNENCYSFLKLYYCCKNCDTIYLREYLYKLQSNWNFTYEVFLGVSTNITKKYNEVIHSSKLDTGTIENYLVDKFNNIQVLISGSENFMATIKDLSMKSQVPEEKICTF
ncbi:hypothetical protein JTB14_006665 [Gonioctena quinquepunctata]|nr:hypothetical protein JTB14_006665 [Gonioctena quinquepunctata]